MARDDVLPATSGGLSRAALALTALLVAFLVLFVILADTAQLGVLGFFYEYEYGDKVSHFALYGLLSLSLNVALLQLRPGPNRVRQVITTTLVLALLIGLEELSQTLFPSRNPDARDLLASYAGVLCGALGAIWLSRRVRVRRE